MGSLWNRSGMVERYADDLRADGAKAFFFQGGTTSPLTVFRDAGESSAHPNPVVADANGRWPDVFVPYVVSYDFQVKSKDDVQITFTLAVPNPNPVDLTVVIPAEERVQTGMIHAEMVNTTKPGYVRLNGRTIGNASSGATERATGLNNTNSDTFNLFAYLYNNLPDSIATVSGGRTVSGAISDFNANKNIVLPSVRGAALFGLDDMGNTAANAFTGLTFTTGSAIIPGSAIGANSVTLSVGQMPAHNHTGTTSVDGQHAHGGQTSTVNTFHTHSGTTATENQTIIISSSGTTIGSAGTGYSLDHSHTYTYFSGVQQGPPGGANLLTAGTTGTTSGASFGSGDHAHAFSASGSQATNHNHNFTTGTDSVNHFHPIPTEPGHSHTFTTTTIGGTTPINNLPLARLVTWFIKL